MTAHRQVAAAKTSFIIRTSKFGQLARAAEFPAASQRLSSVATSTRLRAALYTLSRADDHGSVSLKTIREGC